MGVQSCSRLPAMFFKNFVLFFLNAKQHCLLVFSGTAALYSLCPSGVSLVYPIAWAMHGPPAAQNLE